ncbi:Hypothetical protein I596_3751 [Dokdonella koreensis DS-123]|uniref:DUF4156 domain-containing protein n=2 Tax=Dokdonella TaxID=323413 RepID=A0A160DYL7_9GAMM|nr:Hypothetical protein I596_3751 [Dokdonella koreensis DS-123]
MRENLMKMGVSALLCGAVLAGCSWGIKLDAGGRNVRVAWDGNVSGCTERGKVTVSVLDRVGPVDRSNLKVRDELEVMARNEAAGLQADTIRPLGDPRDGAQSWAAYRCGPAVARPATDRPAERPPQGATETYPIK